MNSGNDFNIFVGGKSGVFKGVKIGKNECSMRNIQSLVSITDNDRVTTISWGDDDEKEILIACGDKGDRSVKIYDTECSTFTCSFFCNVGQGSIVGISRFDGAILTAVRSGEVKLWRFKEEDEIVIKAGENLNRMQHSKVNKNIIATGGLEHKLKLFDLTKQSQIFIEKNLPHDWLQLRVPICISDIGFLPNSEQVVTAGRYGHVRLYDPKAQRRPVINIEVKDEALSTLSIAPKEKQVIVGSGKGKMNLIDLRAPGKILNTYKGFAGGVTGIACSTVEPYVVSVGLDRYLRIHHIDTKKLLKKVYLTSKLTCMLLRSGVSLDIENETGHVQNNSCNISTDDALRQTENLQEDIESDAEYDKLFDKMQVISNKEDQKKIYIKRKTEVPDSLLDNESLPNNSVQTKNGKIERSSKKLKIKASK